MEKFEIGELLELQTQFGMLATVAVIVDVATELRTSIDLTSSSEMADNLLEKLRSGGFSTSGVLPETYPDNAATELWAYLLHTVTSTDLRTAKQMQMLVQHAVAVNRHVGVEAETNLASSVSELLAGPKEDISDARAKKRWDEIVEEDLGDIAKLKREIELVSKKGVLLAVLLCQMEDQVDAMMRVVTDDNESIAGDSRPI